jgi:hypothetical protein
MEPGGEEIHPWSLPRRFWWLLTWRRPASNCILENAVLEYSFAHLNCWIMERVSNGAGKSRVIPTEFRISSGNLNKLKKK